MLRRRHGFSLIELMLVTGLIAVIAGVSVPLIAAGMKRYAVISASHQVAATIRSVRVQAVGTNRYLTVHFETEAGTYQVYDAAGNAVGVATSLPTGAQFADVSHDIEFAPSGRLADPAMAPVNITLGQDNASDNRIIIVSANGRVQLR